LGDEVGAALGDEAGAALGDEVGAALGATASVGGSERAGADGVSSRPRLGAGGGAAERTGAGGALLRAGSGAFGARDGGSGGGTERGRALGADFFGEFGSSAIAGINLTRPSGAVGALSEPSHGPVAGVLPTLAPACYQPPP